MVRGFALVALCSLMGCSGGNTASNSGSTTPPSGNEQQGTPQALSNADDASVAQNTADAAVAPTPPPPAVAVEVGESTPLPAGLNPRVAITAPRDNSTVRTNRVEVRLRVTDWPAPQDARHIHLIVDNEPYRRIDNPAEPIALENLSEGTHVLRAFPGWATHESVKRDGAFAISVFHVGRASTGPAFDRRAPLLTYSRPKGAYNGADAERILLDFYISNIPNNALSATGHRVRYAIDDAVTGEATAWVPHWIRNLQNGEHRIVLELLGPDGSPVAGRFNRIERTITVNRNAPAADPHAGHAATPAATPATTPAALPY